MAQTAFFLTDVFDGKLQATGLPTAPMSSDSPGFQSTVVEGPSIVTGRFEIGTSNKWLDVDEGSGEVNVKINIGEYLSHTVLAAQIKANLDNTLTDTYTVSWVSGRFRISSTGTFKFLWKTGSHGTDNADDNASAELGYTGTADDTSFLSSHDAEDARYSTSVALTVSLISATELNAFLWYAEGGDDDDAADFDDVKVYAGPPNGGLTRDAWIDAGATEIFSASKRPTAETTNQIQIAFQDPDAPTTGFTFFISWRHFDSSKTHRVGLCKAFAVTWDTTNARTIGPLRGHQPISSAPPRSLANYYAPPGIVRWRASMDFPRWEVASWAEVVQAVIRHGRQTGVLWVEDFGTLRTATAAAVLADVKAGKILWGTVQEISGGDAGGQQDAYRTSALTLEQLR